MDKKYLIDPTILGGVVDGILKTSDLDGAKKTEIRDWAIDRLDHNIGIAVLVNLTKEQRGKLEEMLKADAGEDEISKLFEEAGVSLENVMQKEIINIKDEILEKMGEE